ncbi:MAG: DinB family protein [Dehalococcoidia bacterium]
MQETQRRWLLKALREAADEMVEELYDLGPTAETHHTGDDEPSLPEIAAHLCAAEELALAQLQHLVSRRATPLPVQEVESPPTAASANSLHTLLRAFLRARRRTCMLLWQLTPAQWQQQGLHPYRGSITVGQLARALAEHDLEHLWQIRNYKKALATDAGQADEPPV